MNAKNDPGKIESEFFFFLSVTRIPRTDSLCTVRMECRRKVMTIISRTLLQRPEKSYLEGKSLTGHTCNVQQDAVTGFCPGSK